MNTMPTFEAQPLFLQPIFRDYIWGGRNLASRLGKRLPSESNYAESWEVVDHGDSQSVVVSGAYDGWSLRQLVDAFPNEILGSAVNFQSPAQINNPDASPALPLLFKYLDCQRDLSVQVHPDDDYGLKMKKPDLGKTEAWYIVDAKPGAKIFAGLKPGTTRGELANAIEVGETESSLHVLLPQPGDCVFIPAGTVHALGAGLVVAEIQQASDTTFRLFDWNRVDGDGNSRPLHIQQALDVIDFEMQEIEFAKPQTLDEHSQRIVECDKFILDRFQPTNSIEIEADGEFRILSTVAGEATLRSGQEVFALPVGQTVFLPATRPKVAIEPSPSNDPKAAFTMISARIGPC